MKKWLFGSLLAIVSITVLANSTFTFNNTRINPACVAMLNGQMGKNSGIMSIILDVCQNSNAAAYKTLYSHDGYYYFYQNYDYGYSTDSEGANDNVYGYQVLGQTSNNIYVLKTFFKSYQSNAGNGTYQMTGNISSQTNYSLLLTQLQTTSLGTVLKTIGSIPCQHTCNNATLQNDVLTVGNNKLDLKQLSTTAIAGVTNTRGFNFAGKPIDANCLALFNSDRNDHNYIGSFMVSASQKNCAPGVYANYYSYKLIGQATNGIYVVNASMSGSAAMPVFSEIVLLRLQPAIYYNFNKTFDPGKAKQVVTEGLFVKEFVSGEGCSGGFAGAKLTGNNLQINYYNHPTSADCSQITTTTVDLSKL